MANLITAASSNPVYQEWSRCLQRARAHVCRPLTEFMEAEFVLAEGPFEGERFRYSTQPFARLLHEEMQAGRWSRCAVTGCVQAGKSLLGYIAPCCYYLFEERSTTIVGGPTIDMAKAKYKDELLPAILANPKWATLLPKSGAGSQGGIPNEIHFEHGPRLVFMGATGSDALRSGMTASRLVATEVDKYDQPREASRETSPIEQMEARTYAWDADLRRVHLECTVSIEAGAIWTEYTQGTESRLMVQCIDCRAWVRPEREHLTGWQDAETISEAKREGRWVCPACGVLWDDDDRRRMLQRMRLVHRGQEIDAEGNVHGELPDTDTLGFRWSAFDNAFWSTATIAASEWSAARDPDPDTAERRQCQFVWAIPYQPPEWQDTPLDPIKIAQRKEVYPQNILPRDTQCVTAFVDPGKYQSWYLVLAFRTNGRLHIPDYGVIENHVDNMKMDRAVVLGLREFRDRVATGWTVENTGEARGPNAVWIDTGWEPDIVFGFLREFGSWNRQWMGTIGRGESQLGGRYVTPGKITRDISKIGVGWHITRQIPRRAFQVVINADLYKLRFQDGFARGIDEPGSISLFAATGNRHNKISRHITSEQLIHKLIPGRGETTQWEKHGANHWLDCGAGALACGVYCGQHAIQDAPQPEAETLEPSKGWFAARKRR